MRFVLFCLFIVYALNQPEDGYPADSGSALGTATFFVMPVALYSSDTGFGAGVVGIKSYHNDRPRNSTVQFALLVSTRKQVSTTVRIEHYFTTGNRLNAQVVYRKFPTDFFGLGNGTRNTDPENYTPEWIGVECFYEYRIYRDLNIRAAFEIRNLAIVKSERGRMIDSGLVPFSCGRFDAGPGIGLVWDSRDNTQSATRGMYLACTYGGIFLKDAGGSYNTVSLDFRAFFNPVPDLVCGTQVWVSDRRGDVPFYLLANLGGQDRLRGYEDKRFLDRSLFLVQQDIRFLVWRFIGGAAFIGAGRVAPDPGEAFSGAFHVAYGIGARLYLNREEHMVVRADAARGHDSTGFYVTFGEAF